MKTKVAVLFGGRSVEHEVSIISGIQAFAALDRDKYEPVPVYITKDNRFYTGPHMGEIERYRNMDACLREAQRVLLVPGEAGVEMVRYPMKRFRENVVGSFDVAIPVVHGTNVEDGTLMGFLEMLGVPYASCDVTASALGMDKYLMKAAMKQAGLPVLDALQFTGKAYALDSDGVMDQIEGKFPYPLIVKPVNLGSSVGISKAGDRGGLRQALDTALGFSAGYWWSRRCRTCGKSTARCWGMQTMRRPRCARSRRGATRSSAIRTNISAAAKAPRRGEPKRRA